MISWLLIQKWMSVSSTFSFPEDLRLSRNFFMMQTSDTQLSKDLRVENTGLLHRRTQSPPNGRPADYLYFTFKQIRDKKIRQKIWPYKEIEDNIHNFISFFFLECYCIHLQNWLVNAWMVLGSRLHISKSRKKYTMNCKNVKSPSIGTHLNVASSWFTK